MWLEGAVLPGTRLLVLLVGVREIAAAVVYQQKGPARDERALPESVN